MGPLSAPQLLNVWERWLAAPPYVQALAILSAASPDTTLEDLARWCVGRRDAALLRLREWAFGPDMSILARCPRCDLRLEMTLPVASLRIPIPTSENPEFTLMWDEYVLRCRTPNSEDLAACRETDSSQWRRIILGRCTLESRCQFDSIAVDLLPASAIEAAIARMSEVDPQAQTTIALTCPECAHRWDEVFDITTFFWAEIDAWARRLLREIHVLASTYGWTESEILPLSPARRQIYLAMAQA
jgi:hypothetical protein